MADEPENSGSSVIKDKFCEFCETAVRKGQKCDTCKINIIHLKCLDAAFKAGKTTDRKRWTCRTCETTLSSSDSNDEDVTIIENTQEITDADTLQKENSALKTQIQLLNRLLNEMEEVNKLQKQRIEFLENSMKPVSLAESSTFTAPQMSLPTYSSVLRRQPPNLLDSKNVLIITSTNTEQTGEPLSKKLKQAINPSSLSIEVNGVMQRKNGKVIINCKDPENLETLKSNIADKFGDDLKVEIPQKINPKIIIFNVSAADVEDRTTFCNNVVVQNKLQKTTSSLLRVVRVVGRRSTVNVIVEVDPILFKEIITKRSLFIGWRRCYIKESFHILRCYKCNKYGHLVKECKSAVTCPQCAGEHPLKECSNKELKCINCFQNNNKFKTKYSTNHSVLDDACPCFIKLVNRAKSLTKYDPE